MTKVCPEPADSVAMTQKDPPWMDVSEDEPDVTLVHVAD